MSEEGDKALSPYKKKAYISDLKNKRNQASCKKTCLKQLLLKGKQQAIFESHLVDSEVALNTQGLIPNTYISEICTFKGLNVH